MLESCQDLVCERHRLASAFHETVCVPADAFHQCVRRVAQRHFGTQPFDETSLRDFIGSLHTNDLFLAVACARGSDEGWLRFFELYRKYLNDLCRHLMSRGADYLELSANVSADLYLLDKSGNRRIASYDGRSSLATWLRVVASNRIINDRSRKASRVGNLDVIPEPADPTALSAVEAQLGRNRYRSAILSCFQRATNQLSPHERLVILLRFDCSVQLGEIAKIFDVHQSTITRQIDKVTARLRADVSQLLSSEYGLSRSAIDECLDVASETLSMSSSVLNVLRESVEQDEHAGAVLASFSSR